MKIYFQETVRMLGELPSSEINFRHLENLNLMSSIYYINGYYIYSIILQLAFYYFFKIHLQYQCLTNLEKCKRM
jgi:hypothetical protein